MKTFLDPRVLLTLVLFGCPFAGDGRLDRVRDADGDKDPAIAFGGHDCDDTNPNVNSNAVEDWSNDIDDDCDGNAFDQDGDGYQRDVDCDDEDAAANVDRTWYEDGDGDGFRGMTGVVSCRAPGEGWVAEQGTDCDDTDALAFPQAQETLCDGVDNDCDAEIDESDDVTYTSWWPDLDGDHFGDRRETPVSTCDGAPGVDWADNQLDCDDADATRSPDADEVCDDIDNDCDDDVDEPGDVTWTTYWLDLDGDGAGYSGNTWSAPGVPAFTEDAGSLSSCAESAPAGYADNQDDCDDSDPDVQWFTWYPDGDGDGYGASGSQGVDGCFGPATTVANDDDCDDADAEEHPGARWYDDLDGDGFGVAGAPVTSCTRPASKVADATDCDDDDPDVHPGAPGEQVHDGVDTNCDDATEFDGPDANDLPDLACGPTIAYDVDPSTLQQALDAAGTCKVLIMHVSADQHFYGPVTLPASGEIALIGAPFEDVAFVSPIGGQAIVGPPGSSVDLLIEKVTFQGWDTAVALNDGSLTLSEVLVSDGEGVTRRTGGDGLAIYDSAFTGVDLIYDPSWTGGGRFADVSAERVVAAFAVAPHVVLLGGTSTTSWRDLVVTNSAAIVSVLQIPDPLFSVAARNVAIDGLVVRDSLGRALDVPSRNGDDIVLWNVALDGNISVDRGLVAVQGPGLSLQGPTLDVENLVARDNTMEVFSATQSDLRSQAMFDFTGVGTTMEGVTLIGNETGESWLLQGEGAGSHVVLAGTGDRGLRFGGTLDHLTFVGFGAGVDAIDSYLTSDLTLRDAIVDQSGTAPLTARLHLDRVIIGPDSALTCGLLEACVERTDPLFLRYDPLAPSELWDFRVLPPSPAIAGAGSCPFTGACDLGAYTPANVPEQYDDADGDGLYDTWEEQFFGDAALCLPGQNADGDGFTNGQEFFSGTLPTMSDFDLDGLLDGPADTPTEDWDQAPWDPAHG
ncbi:MAG: putative metal-binding motif-containing protein [Alphaproteobacteria bacterium]|nr:putative metal-binding motif-containing protein [Alphaproteobacteria bacterium]